ncbi:27892_t:CDS:1, partial [Racocetra persica]
IVVRAFWSRHYWSYCYWSRATRVPLVEWSRVTRVTISGIKLRFLFPAV